ncbi:hypothetical protein GGI19_002309 [Coemansia pectinata]|uniref:Uncharacterized protein n=1 Tax=Coemansia pectinata TaxID=1052879 RepID=A0A9W8H2Z8_9FUNG|nr:hypothetical protein GGI19_002309 [Coemansia pectinata]
MLLIPLTAACPSFTSPAYARIFRVYDMELTNTSGEDRYISPFLLTAFRVVGVPAHLFSKELIINAGVLDICNGAVLKELSCEPYIDIRFLKVRAIRFAFSLPSESEIASPDTESNISAFVERIRQITPMLRKIGISLRPRISYDAWFPVWQFDSLVAQLSQHAVDIDYDIERQPLARRRSSILQSLSIFGDAIADLSSLFMNTDGSYVQYPCLNTFKLIGSRGSDGPRSLSFSGVRPLPNLRRLDIGYVYPFGDDTVFRGNGATLKSLSLKLSPRTVRILREHGVFTPVSHPRLQHVRVELRSNSEPNTFRTDVDYMRFVLSIGPSAPVRTVFDSLIGLAFQSAIPVFREYTCIQVLMIPFVPIRLWEAIALIKGLPLLSDLHTLIPSIEPWPTGVPKHKLPAYVITNYAPTGKRFRCWHFDIIIDLGHKNVIRCALLLALVCPNFDYANVGVVHREVFMAHMKEMITTDGFRPHAARLRRLLFGGARNEIRSIKTIQTAKEASREMGLVAYPE